MEEIAREIALITKDYHSDYENGFVMSENHIMEWVNQFEIMDREFVLSELLHILNQGTYISRAKAMEILWEFINKATTFFGYQNCEIFLRETHFINSQAEHKSQSVLLLLLNEVLIENIGQSLEICSTLGIKNYIYLDDVLASGGTFKFAIKNIIQENNILNALINKDLRVLSFFFCTHSWGVDNARYSLKKLFDDENYFLDVSKFPIGGYYKIENNLRGFNPKLNLVYPEKSKNEYDVYLVSLENATLQSDKAYRKATQPSQEVFFSSRENRNRLEKIFLDKGIEIIKKIQDETTKHKHRPLGKTYPSYKTFGTGTLFFTWRNISNTCPIVFWWDNPAHNWRGLFPLHNRGN
ncbi:phosphoribosyltransferase-like protein [Flavobacterium covae]|uniref:phosphoribosyltransferase-like protein n=1 Tax=Flavobacterium covae TaxID=2906076 RepID=UPI000745DC1B|nr:hypothetical protein [Flavobacterium covae]AMA48760.1 hypothetical protein AWN65_04425 [Flavobacterium covae]MCJ1805450.1 hypothetical protein [Flavobacterium covae]MCJ1808005.1 hypothetical protein [Flavobacterium covae]